MIKQLFKLPSYITILFPIILLTGSAVADVGMSAVAMLFLLKSFVEKDWQWTKEAWIRCLLLLWIYMIGRSCFAEEPQEALRRSLPFVRYFVFAAALACWTLRDEATRKKFLCVLTGVLLFLAADGLLQWFTGHDLFRHVPNTLHGHTRLTGPFRSEILGIMLTWLSFPIFLRLIMDEQGKLNIRPHSAAILLILAAIVLSGERMALLLTVMGWFIAICIMPGRKLYLLGIFAAGLALVAALTLASPELFSRQVLSTMDTIDNWHESPYGQLLDSDMKVAAVDPVFGVGTNHFRIVCKEVIAQPDACNIHPHNIYMEWLIEQGIIGLCLWIAFIVALARACIRSWPAVRYDPVFLGTLIAVVVRLWPFMSTTGFFSRWGAPPFWLIIGLFLVYVTRSKVVNPEKAL